MILPDFKAFPRTGRLLGVDWGARRTGIAVSDASREFVFVRDAICHARGGASTAQRVAEIAAAEKVCAIVVGRPVRGDGTQSETTTAVRAFAADLATYTDLPIAFIDENLTSRAAQEEMGRVRVADIKANLDSMAARVILENAISVVARMK